MVEVSEYPPQEIICESHEATLYRSRRPESGSVCLVKVFKTAEPSPVSLDRFRHEYDIIRSLKAGGLPDVIDVLTEEEVIAVIFKDFPGHCLQGEDGGVASFGVSAFLATAVQLAEAVGCLHQAGIVHKGIRPQNILVDPDTNSAQFIGFGIEAELFASAVDGCHPEFIRDTLAYMSPEQTGRMQQPVGEGTDFYSLGVVLYEMLTGRKPFAPADPASLIHAHMAASPPSPAIYNPDVPEVLSDIIMKLLAKIPEERYRNGFGLMHDLWECLERLKRQGFVDAFALGQKDFSSRFRIPSNMVGRSAEVEILRQAFERVAAGENEFVLVSGPAGIGKSALIREFRNRSLPGGVYFIAGKHDQFCSQEPYASLHQALRDLVRQVLAESPGSIRELQQHLTAALKPSGRIVTDALPELELIIGKQPELQTLGIEEERNRFDHVWKNFIRVFAATAGPLVVFTDDLQWTDEETLRFLRRIVNDQENGRVLWVGAWRESPAGEDDAIAGLPAEVRRITRRVTRLHMRPMDLTDVGVHIADILCCKPERSRSLAELIHAKTGGNPFFVNQFMSALHENRLLTFSPQSGWQWDIRAIRLQELSENVAVLLSERLAALPADTRESLKICACVGVSFDLEVAAAVGGVTMNETLTRLQPAIAEGLIECTEDSCHFTHDRIQEAAYERIPETERPLLDYRIGRRSLHRMETRGDRGGLFYAVNKLNQGLAFIHEPGEKALLRDLNFEAGRKAKSSAAYSRAAVFFNTAIGLLPAHPWEAEYEKCLAVHLELAVCEHLCHRFETAERIFDLTLAKAASARERAEVYNLKLQMLANLTRFQEALEAGRQGLRLLGVNLPKKGSKRAVLWHVVRIRRAMSGRRPSELLDLPAMTDTAVFLAMKILMNLTMSAYFVSTDYGILMALKMMELSLRHGNSSISPYAYAVYGVTIGAGFGDYARGARFGRLAERLHERLGLAEIEAKIPLIVGGGIAVWNRPLIEALALTRKALDKALENGDLNSAIYAVQSIAILMTCRGAPLGELMDECRRRLDFITRTKDPGALNSLRSILQFAKSLRDETSAPFRMDDESFVESDHLRDMESDGIPIILGRHHILKMQLHVLAEEYDQAFQSALESEKWLPYSLGMIVTADHAFYMGLIALELLGRTGSGGKAGLLRRAVFCRRRLKRWARFCPWNFRHKELLLDAEMARLHGRTRKAMQDYDRAVSSARENGFVQDAALAAERAAGYYLAMGLDRQARPLIFEARSNYQRWGAAAKIRLLEKRHPHLLAEAASRESGEEGDRRAVILSTIDLKTLRGALKTLAEETIHSRMVEKTIRTSIQIAGAQKGILVLRNETRELFVEGEGSVDREEISILQSIPMESFPGISQAVVNYVRRTSDNIVVQNVMEPPRQLLHLASDPYIQRTGVKSLLCLPLLVTGGAEKELLGLVYLENNRATHAFTSDIVEMLEIICLSAAGRLELSRKAVKDGLTGLYNHEYFQNVLQQELLLSQRQNRQLALLMIDIDHFKRFNDNWGHLAGDAVLQQVSLSIGMVCRKSDIIARYGGEEIAVILRETDVQTAFTLGEKLRRTVEELEIPHPLRTDERLRVTVSLGVAVYPLDAADKTGLIQRADEALYRSKSLGRNRVTGRRENGA
ncbi:MAG: diguanylate cyclase [Thermodesulfobacteriota bacterium]